MNQREKILAGIVGGLILLFIGNAFWSSIQAGIETKRNEVEKLQKNLSDQKLAIQQGTLASQKIAKATPRSASKREENARAEYERWLIELATKSNLREPQYQNLPSSVGKDGFHIHKFKVTGAGTLQTATKLLHEFYSKPFLHRITQLEMRPVSSRDANADPDAMVVSITTEFLGIPTARDVQVPLPSDPALVPKSLEEYEKSIVHRNLFGPANQPPEMSPTKQVDAVQGIAVDYTVTAKDPDPKQKLTYAVEGEKPEGFSIDASTGKLRWTGKDLGEYKVTVKATDSGLPSKSATQLLTIQVKPPPPPRVEPPKFDVASQAKLTGLVTDGVGPEAWIFSLTEGKLHKLREGAEMVLGDVKGKVVSVGANYMEVETDGRKWTIGLEEAVSDAYKRGMID